MTAKGLTCTVCHRREALYFRRYSGERLCGRCFMGSIEAKTRATVARFRMLRFNDRIAVAVSGGKDSVSLLHVLSKLEKDHPKSSLLAITVDEGIKGYRDEALRIAAENCRKLGVEHVVASFKELFGHSLDDIVRLRERAGNGGVTTCAVCGVLRRRALNLAARNVEADKLATAHTLDDEAQTVLLNIFHGDVWRLAKEKPVTDEVHPKLVRRIKPFCEIPEKETALFAYLKRVELQSKPCPYASDALRNDVRMMLNRLEENRAGIKFTIFNSIERIRPALEQVYSKEGLGECSECGEPTSEKTCRTCQMLKEIRST